jgi:hypothetical protein
MMKVAVVEEMGQAVLVVIALLVLLLEELQWEMDVNWLPILGLWRR